ncbi:uncharacterized protein TM35_000501230, partial [Trypanosoma theileri]
AAVLAKPAVGGQDSAGGKAMLEEAKGDKQCDASLGEEAKKKLCQTPAAAASSSVVQKAQEEQTGSLNDLQTNPQQLGGVHGSSVVSTAGQGTLQPGQSEGSEQNPLSGSQTGTSGRPQVPSNSDQETPAANAQSNNTQSEQAQNTEPSSHSVTPPSSS